MNIPPALIQTKQIITLTPEAVVRVVLVVVGICMAAVILMDGVLFYRYGMDTGAPSTAGGISPADVVRVDEDVILSTAAALHAREERFQSARIFSEALPNPFR